MVWVLSAELELSAILVILWPGWLNVMFLKGGMQSPLVAPDVPVHWLMNRYIDNNNISSSSGNFLSQSIRCVYL